MRPKDRELKGPRAACASALLGKTDGGHSYRDIEFHCRTKASSAVPLEVIAELIESEVGPIQREPGGIFFDGTVGTTHIRLTPVDVNTIDRDRGSHLVTWRVCRP